MLIALKCYLCFHFFATSVKCHFYFIANLVLAKAVVEIVVAVYFIIINFSYDVTQVKTSPVIACYTSKACTSGSFMSDDFNSQAAVKFDTRVDYNSK